MRESPHMSEKHWPYCQGVYRTDAECGEATIGKDRQIRLSRILRQDEIQDEIYGGEL